MPETAAGNAPVSTATGVYLYVAMARAFFALAAAPAIMLARNRFATPGGAPHSIAA